MERNIEQFGLYAAVLLDELYEKFPLGVTVRASDLIRRPWAAQLDARVELVSALPAEDGPTFRGGGGRVEVGVLWGLDAAAATDEPPGGQEPAQPAATAEPGEEAIHAADLTTDDWEVKQKIVAEMLRLFRDEGYVRFGAQETVELGGKDAPTRSQNHLDYVFRDCVLTGKAVSRLLRPFQDWGIQGGAVMSVIDALQSRVVAGVRDETVVRLIGVFLTP